MPHANSTTSSPRCTSPSASDEHLAVLGGDDRGELVAGARRAARGTRTAPAYVGSATCRRHSGHAAARGRDDRVDVRRRRPAPPRPATRPVAGSRRATCARGAALGLAADPVQDRRGGAVLGAHGDRLRRRRRRFRGWSRGYAARPACCSPARAAGRPGSMLTWRGPATASTRWRRRRRRRPAARTRRTRRRPARLSPSNRTIENSSVRHGARRDLDDADRLAEDLPAQRRREHRSACLAPT